MCVAQPQNFWLAFAVSLFGELIQLWCFASLDKRSTLAYNGLYKHTRNPMYLGRFFIVLGYIILLGNLYMIAFSVIIYLPYMWYRVQREEKKLKKIFGSPYIEYSVLVNRFIPSWKGMPGGILWFWQWKLFNQNHGWINLSAMLLSFAVAFIWLYHL
jgi:steroid 5-alpha reductase family enzyme